MNSLGLMAGGRHVHGDVYEELPNEISRACPLFHGSVEFGLVIYSHAVD